jgi:hypothetical protein
MTRYHTIAHIRRIVATLKSERRFGELQYHVCGTTWRVDVEAQRGNQYGEGWTQDGWTCAVATLHEKSNCLAVARAVARQLRAQLPA